MAFRPRTSAGRLLRASAGGTVKGECVPRAAGRAKGRTGSAEPGRVPAAAAVLPVHENLALYRRLLELATDWYWEHDTELTFSWTARQRPPGAGSAGGGCGPAWQPGGLMPRQGDWDDYRALIAGHEPFRDFDLVHRGPDGSVEHLSISGEPMFAASGEFLGYCGVGRDLTEQRRGEELRRIEHEVTRCLAEVGTADEALQSALHTMCSSEGWVCGEYWAVNETAQVLAFRGYWDGFGAAAGPEIRRLFEDARGILFPPGVGLAGRVWQSREPMWIADVSNDERLLRKDLARRAGLHGAFLFPTFAAGTVTGVFAFWSQAIRQPDPRTMEAVAAIGSQVGQFMCRKDAEQVLRESEARFRALTELSSDWYWEQDATDRFIRMEGRNADQVAHCLGRRPREVGFRVDAAWQEAHGRVVAARAPFRDLIITGSVGGDTRSLSVSGAPTFDAAGGFTGYRGVARDITERKLAEERISYLAMHDGLTGLPNRVMFSQILAREIESARRYDRKFTVLFIDLDRFKTINDTLGHEAGDQLLCEVSARLQQSLRSSDVVARLGGDEFVVLLEETPSEADASAAARKILTTVIRPIMIRGQECRVTASIGISMYPADAQDEPSLMKSADMAMYMAKEAGKNNFQRYSGEIRSLALEKMAIETQLRRALESNEFSLQYQAKLTLSTHTISGVEALLRWNNPTLGSISPAQFIPIAEETGLIVPIGKWVLRTACQQNMAWQAQGLPPVCMAVNLSPRQFSDPSLVADLQAVLADTGLPPHLLELEITESMVMRDTARTLELLLQIKTLGVSLAIDDFGTGYSSLAQLRRFPIDTLKVDRSFIREITKNGEDEAITEAIITMGKTLSLTVVAEGVETPEQMALLQAKSCDQMQGFHFSKPISPQQFAELLRSHLRPGTRAVVLKTEG